MTLNTLAKAPAPQANYAPRLFDLDTGTLRELNQALHGIDNGAEEPTWEILNPKGMPRRRRRTRPACQCRGARQRRLLLRRHEPGGQHRRPRLGRARRGRKHDVGQGRREGRCQPVCGRHRPRRAAGDRGQRLVALRHLDEGHRYRGAGQYRPHVGVHGPVGRPGGARRRRRRARRFDLRGAAVRARQGQEPRRRLHRQGDAPRAHCRAARTARPCRDHRREGRRNSPATVRPARSTISTSTTPKPTEGGRT